MYHFREFEALIEFATETALYSQFIDRHWTEVLVSVLGTIVPFFARYNTTSLFCLAEINMTTMESGI